MRSDINKYCSIIGADPLLVQGAGGNVSWKDNNTLWIKASGTWLADAENKDIFVPVNLSDLRSSISQNNFAVTPKLVSDSKLRPSIETLLHALMPHRVVVHLHAIEPLAYLVRENPEHEISSRLGADCSWEIASYQKPGEPLAKAVAAALNKSPHANILLLQNHGIVIGGTDVAEISSQLQQILSKLNAPELAVIKVTENPQAIIIDDNQKYLPVDIPNIHNLAINTQLFHRVATDWALYPDHVVFLGHKAACYDSVDLLISDSGRADLPELIFLKGQGVFAKQSFGTAKQAQLKCYYDVIVRQPISTRLNPLSTLQISELLNWDAEHYRQTIAKE